MFGVIFDSSCSLVFAGFLIDVGLCSEGRLLIFAVVPPTGDGPSHISFNQDCSCFSVGTSEGFHIFDSSPFKIRFKREFGSSLRIVEMLGRSNILALVGVPGSKFPPDKVVLWDDYHSQPVAVLGVFRSEVKGVRLRSNRVVIILEDITFVYGLQDLNLLDQIETFSNPKGLCALSTGDDLVLACMGEKIGEVRIDVYGKGNSSHTISAHTSAVTQLLLDPSGRKVATSSEQGTIIRVFDSFTGEKLFEFRRGSSTAIINSLSFNSDSTLLCVASSTGTIHVYSCEDPNQNTASSLSLFSGWIPLAGDVWSAKQIYLENETNYISAFIPRDDTGKQVIVVLSSSGQFYRYSINSFAQEEFTLDAPLCYSFNNDRQ